MVITALGPGKPSDFHNLHVHLMGIGGAGMSALVPLLQRVGARLSGCDLADNEHTRRFRAAGLPVELGHGAEHLAAVDILVHTSAVSHQHVEIRAAQALGIPVLSRQACLAALLSDRCTVAVAGSHGKTSTTWMIGHLLAAAGFDPVVLVGGTVAALGSGARMGDGDWAVVEVDESDGGFAHTQPAVAVVTNLEPEHLDHYGSFAALCATFATWLGRMGPEQHLVLPAGDFPAAALRGVSAQQISVGLDAGMLQAREIVLGAEGSQCRVQVEGLDLGPMQVPIPGRHMITNALMAVAAVIAVSGRRQVPLQALANSGRVARRFTHHGVVDGVRVIEDYAHHPTEIRATLAAAALYGGRLQVLFQPHRYTRTRDLLPDFASCFDAAHALVVVPTYAASEEPLPGAGAEALAAAVADHRSDQAPALTQHSRQWSAAIAFLCAHAQDGDSILVLGAGDIGECLPQLLSALAQRKAEMQ
ncbi:MAG: UDP-N-acetylmuramate--L-alanine ligase [Planctomycetota bacterium]|nr:MAG: UDP-N-acetylmuramate--L-alanine ligase [Planctomycetota bacterium]